MYMGYTSINTRPLQAWLRQVLIIALCLMSILPVLAVRPVFASGCCYELVPESNYTVWSCIPGCSFGTCFHGVALCIETELRFIECVGEDNECPEPRFGGTVHIGACDTVSLPLGNRKCDFWCLNPPGFCDQGSCPGGTFALVADCPEGNPECCEPEE